MIRPKTLNVCCPQSSCLLRLWFWQNVEMFTALGVTRKSIRSTYISTYVCISTMLTHTYVCMLKWSDCTAGPACERAIPHHMPISPPAPAAGTSARPSWSTGASLTSGSMSTSPPTTPWGSTSAGRDWQGSAPASRPGTGGGGGCKAVHVLKSVCDQTCVMYVRHMYCMYVIRHT